MSRVSIIIPSRVETFEVNPGENILQRTVRDIYEKATGDIEVIVAFDGPPYCSFPEYRNFISLEMPWAGSKPAFNEAAKIASGKYIMKLDAHCMVAEGFDEVLQVTMEDNWVVMPRFYVLNAEEWKWQDERFYDYFFLPCPFTYKHGFMFQAGGHWKNRTAERLNISIDENMKLHGSSFFMTKDFFWNCIGGLHSEGSGTWNGEDIEITMKTWLGPWSGKLMVNKNTWYAHMHRGGQRPREWYVSYNQALKSAHWTANYWMKNQWADRKQDISWLIKKFWPVPGWPDNWETLYQDWLGRD